MNAAPLRHRVPVLVSGSRVDVINSKYYFTVLIGGLLHLRITKAEVVHIQVWKNSNWRFWATRYNVEYHLKNGTLIETGYNDPAIWLTIMFGIRRGFDSQLPKEMFHGTNR